ncbi:calcium/sodium antiporter [Motilimonas cestriensis]|uniref:calcium/sodium antiporter n=1 Tax=Motilimonas cestriensis TaxID=2742685 RepID=UPI003DA5288B
MVYLLLVLGLVLLIYGADCLVKGAARLALSAGIPSLVVGLTVVAFGTSAPELAVSIGAAFSGETEMAIANVVGSNIFNVLFILGLAAIISPLVISKQLIKQDVPIMVAISALVFWLVRDGMLSRIDAAILVVLLISYTSFLFIQGKKSPPETEDDDNMAAAPWWQNVLWVIAGFALLVIGAQLLVANAVAIAQSFGVSEAVIGLTIVAIGTSLPEVVTSLVATVKGQRDIAVGNVIGSNVFNLLAVLGVSGLIAPSGLTADAALINLDLPVMLGVALLCVPLFFTGAALSRLEGINFFVLYLVYTAYLISSAIQSGYQTPLGQVAAYVIIPLTAILVLSTLIWDLKQRRARSA